jgi:hypothetical protein
MSNFSSKRGSGEDSWRDGKRIRLASKNSKSDRSFLCSINVPLESSRRNGCIICNEQHNGEGRRDKNDGCENLGRSLEMSGSGNAFTRNTGLCLEFVVVGIDVRGMGRCRWRP